MLQMTKLQYKLIINRTLLRIGVDSNIIFTNLYSYYSWCEQAFIVNFGLYLWIYPCILCQRLNILTNRLGRWGSNRRGLRGDRLHILRPQSHPLKCPPDGMAFCLAEWPLQTEWCKSREYSQILPIQTLYMLAYDHKVDFTANRFSLMIKHHSKSKK